MFAIDMLRVAIQLRPHRHHQRRLPPPWVPMCPGCSGDVRAGTRLEHAELDAVALGQTWRCSCGMLSRWLMCSPPHLLAWADQGRKRASTPRN